ncbi:hypothetical protein EON83_23705 [bacterium]|nr:MAG: hypothetical protein EON83_23705 [bacterium]
MNSTPSDSATPLSPEQRAEIEAELRAVGGPTLPLGAPPPETVPKSAAPAPKVEEPVCVTSAESHKIENAELALSFSQSPDEIFRDSFPLEIVCAVPGARIFYALDSEEVDENGLLFDAKKPLVLTQTTQVTARAYTDDAVGPTLSARFDIVKPVWKEIEPADQSDPTPHKASGNLQTTGWNIAAASVRGKLHAHRGSWREDSFTAEHIQAESGDWTVVAVSDGAGSAPLSRVGSKAACSATLTALRAGLGTLGAFSDDKEQLVSQNLPALRQVLMQAGADALGALQIEAKLREQPLSAFAATLLVLVQREWSGAWLCAALQVGDGAISLWDGEKIVLLGEADHGQNSGETRFLTTSGIENELASRVKFSIKPQLQGFAVMSDGVSDDFFPEDTKLAELFAAVLPVVTSAEDAGQSLISWLGYEKRGSSDDRTLVIGWPKAKQSAEANSGE